MAQVRERGAASSRSRGAARSSRCIGPGIWASLTAPSIWFYQAQGAQVILLDIYPAAASASSSIATRSSRSCRGARLDARHRLRAARRQGEGVGQWQDAGSRRCQAWASSPCWCRCRLCRMASTRSAACCRCACFIRAARSGASTRWSSTGANGTMSASPSSLQPFMIGLLIPPTPFAIWLWPGACRPSAPWQPRATAGGIVAAAPDSTARRGGLAL